MKDDERDDTIFSRLGKLEQENASITSDIKSLSNAVQGLVQEFREYKTSNKTNFGVMASWAALILSAVIYHNSLSLSPVKESMATMKSYLETHVKSVSESNKRESEGEDKVLRSEIELKGVNLNGRLDTLSVRMDKIEEHTKESGHPYVQNERLKTLEKMIEVKSADRYTRSEADKDIGNINDRLTGINGRINDIIQKIQGGR